MNVDIEADLAQTLADISERTTPGLEPTQEDLAGIATLLTGFAMRHGDTLTFEHFPLPTGDDDALCSYEINSDEASGLTLYLNAIRGGVDSVIHDHGTWAVIVGIAGHERNRIYRGDPAQGELSLEREANVSKGESLILEAGLFHSIHTPPAEPALQLHLYGQPIDRVTSRRLIDPQSGESVHVAGLPPAE